MVYINLSIILKTFSSPEFPRYKGMNSTLTKMQKCNLLTFGQSGLEFTKVYFKAIAVVTTDKGDDFNGIDIIKRARSSTGVAKFWRYQIRKLIQL